jgi:hypothetical protein
MTKTTLSWACIAALASALGLSAGCLSSAVEQHWGESKRGVTARMIANPDAGDTRPIEGLDPITGEIVVETYEKNLRKQERNPKEIFLIEQ